MIVDWGSSPERQRRDGGSIAGTAAGALSGEPAANITEARGAADSRRNDPDVATPLIAKSFGES